MSNKIKCPVCDGVGAFWNTCQCEGDPECYECSNCNGMGEVEEEND